MSTQVTSQRLRGKTALVTGGAMGFGKAIVTKFVAEGAQVLVLDIMEPSPAEAQDESSKNITYLRGDVTSAGDWQEALGRVLSIYGHLDIVVNNAGVLHRAQPSIGLSDEDWERVFRVNVKQIYLSTKTIIPYFLKERRPGLFINTSSMSGTRPRPNLVWYGASKGAVNNATKGLAVEWAPHNIRVNAVCPSVGDTSMMPLFLGQDSSAEAHAKMLSSIPLGRVCQPADVANSIAFLASDEASYLTGVCLEVDGGRGI
ncbi:alcohol dehydrogenase [Penicillium canescens]|uniref:Alcohol dehydrogenase n=1 Tax=Penicillium canescens TaxID=5083 RepID=A0AAD6IG34_PENCN|nr:alcohol dehydrogenase [Penicillium canescens]KAJ6028893.1 alcohol dehydrogenase [Penicillium canescens]KAJ6047326.1 alcohol dehydrogenase [Penicillium canescens]KAJ6049086.1 alcohol dehydrogenase [Penicillium canescens]